MIFGLYVEKNDVSKYLKFQGNASKLQPFLVADTRLYFLPCRSVCHILEFRAVFSLLLLPNCPRLDCRVSILVIHVHDKKKNRHFLFCLIFELAPERFNVSCLKTKQGCIHSYRSRKQVGRGEENGFLKRLGRSSDAKTPVITERTDGPTNQPI